MLKNSLPAPQELFELSTCGFNRNCSSNSCKCNNNEFYHTDMRKCKIYINIKYKTNKEIKTDITFDVPDVEELEGT